MFCISLGDEGYRVTDSRQFQICDITSLIWTSSFGFEDPEDNECLFYAVGLIAITFDPYGLIAPLTRLDPKVVAKELPFCDVIYVK